MITFVGVGPGDPELLTLKAVRAIRAAEVVAVPQSGDGMGAAERIVASLLKNKETLRLQMPMRGAREAWLDAHEKAAQALAEQLERGREVVYLALGDPLFYATSGYLIKRLRQRFETRVIPGVPAMCAAAAQLRVPLCEAREPLTVLPGFAEGDALPAGNVVIMKAGGHLREILAAGFGREMYLARNLGMPGEYAGPLAEANLDEKAYFSTVIIRRSET